MALFSWQKKTDDKGEEKFELPDEIVTQLKEGKETKEKLGKMETLLQGLVDTQQADKTAREKAVKDAADAAARAQHGKKQDELDAELEDLILTNPKEAIRRATEGQSVAIMTLRADNIRRETFEDQDKFKYYAGSIKAEVDALIAGQSLAARNDPSVVENCYHTVMGKHVDEIAEGKLKSRFAAGTGSSSGTSSGSAGSSGTGGKEKTKIDTAYEADIRKAAKQVGIKYEDYVEMLDKEGVL